MNIGYWNKSSTDNYTVAVSKDLIIKSMKKRIKDINYKRNKIWEQMIKEKMNKKLFSCKTREKAIEKIKKSKKLSSIVYWNGSFVEDRAIKLLKAARASSTEIIYLNINDAAFVGHMLENQYDQKE